MLHRLNLLTTEKMTNSPVSQPEMLTRSSMPHLPLSLIVSAMIILTVAACGEAAQPTDAPSFAPNATATPTPEPVPTSTRAPAPTKTPEVEGTPTPETKPELGAVTYPAVPGIVDPMNHGWPREVETSEGRVTLEAPPQRILTYSLGHDEMLLALVKPERIAALGKFAGSPSYSNVVEQAAELPVFEKGAENVIAANPDLFIVSAYTKQDLVDLVKDAGIPVVRPALESSADGNIPNILLMGYMLGAEERALELVADIEGRLRLIDSRVPPLGDADRPAVISITRYSDSISISGDGTSGSGIIGAAGGVNAAARDGIEGFQKISVESIVSMSPQFILIPQGEEAGGNQLRDDLLGDPVLATVPAIANGAVHLVDAPNFITLSHWNVRGIERTAEILFPDLFADVTFSDFEPYSGE